MQKIVVLLLLSLSYRVQSCQPSAPNTSQVPADSSPPESADLSQPHQDPEPIIPGAARLQEYLPLLAGKKVAMMVNQTSLVDDTHLVDLLLDKGVQIVQIFAPEHGFRGDHSAGAHVQSSRDAKTGLPIVSLYGQHRKPTAEMLKGIDLVIFDIQDVGVRFYTYLSSMHYLMEACADNHLDFLLLDRPNPNGHYVDGPVLEKKYKSFIGMHEVPLVHGMTPGEFAGMIAGESWLNTENKLRFKIITCVNYTHQTRYKLPVRPSPNLPNMTSVYLYPSLGLFEGTNVSVGRGTEFPFQVLARPYEQEGNIEFTPIVIPGVADDPKHLGKLCKGLDLRAENLADSELDSIRLQWLQHFYQSNQPELQGLFFKSTFVKLAGTMKLQEQIEQGIPAMEIRATWQEELTRFKLMRKKYLLYPE